MATFTKLPSGKWRVQVRKAGVYKGATFATKAEARSWAGSVEQTANHLANGGYAPPPKGATLADLIYKYTVTAQGYSPWGRNKVATMKMLTRRLGHVKLSVFSAAILRDFIDQRQADGAGGVTIAADLSYLSAVLKWARYSRNLDVPDKLPIEARASLKHRGLRTRSQERDREPTQEELLALYSYWKTSRRREIDMTMLVKFALATGMRLGEICRITFLDLDCDKRTVIIRDRKDPHRKAGNHQVVPLLPGAWEILEPLLTKGLHGTIFGVKAASVSSAFTRACSKIGIPDLRFHDLRHKATADFFRAGLDIPNVALLTGHKTWAMLQRYTSIKACDVHGAYGRLQLAQGGENCGNI